MLPARRRAFTSVLQPTEAPEVGAGSRRGTPPGAGTLRKGAPIMAKDGPRIIVKMESSAGTGFYYTTTKNRRNTQAKMELRKYDPVAKKHVVFKEKKV
jgi:large subunit ribosomal protein L33